VRLIHALLHNALKQAVRWRVLNVNPADAVDAPRVERKEFRSLDADEANQLLETARTDRLRALYVTALTCGMRQGELLGLRWTDLDLERGALAVRQQVMRVGGEWRFSEPKTKAGRRVITMPAVAIDALREHRRQQLEERLRAGGQWRENGLVFTNRVGNPIEKQNLMRRSFWPLLDCAGLPRIRFHDLRHTAATLLLAEGLHPKVVQERLGHSTIAVTMDVYSHVGMTLQREAADTLDRLFARG
jgi:integrase